MSFLNGSRDQLSTIKLSMLLLGTISARMVKCYDETSISGTPITESFSNTFRSALNIFASHRSDLIPRQVDFGSDPLIEQGSLITLPWAERYYELETGVPECLEFSSLWGNTDGACKSGRKELDDGCGVNFSFLSPTGERNMESSNATVATEILNFLDCMCTQMTGKDSPYVRVLGECFEASGCGERDKGGLEEYIGTKVENLGRQCKETLKGWRRLKEHLEIIEGSRIATAMEGSSETLTVKTTATATQTLDRETLGTTLASSFQPDNTIGPGNYDSFSNSATNTLATSSGSDAAATEIIVQSGAVRAGAAYGIVLLGTVIWIWVAFGLV